MPCHQITTWNCDPLPPIQATAMLHNSFYLGINEVYQPSRWQMILPALLQWCSFVTLHNVAAEAFGRSRALEQDTMAQTKPYHINIIHT